MNKVIETMKEHRSIRNYTDKEISEEIINELVNAAQSAPNSINGQQTSLIVIKDKATKEKLAELTGGQSWVAAAPVFFIFIADFYKIKIASEITGLPMNITESVESIMVASVDAGLSAQNLMTAAESLGIGIVPIGGVRKNPDEVIKLLGLPKYTFPILGVGVGYPSGNSKIKPRMPKTVYRHDEKYNSENIKEGILEYDKEMASYLEEIGRTQEVNWSSQTMNVYQNVYYPKVYPVLKDQGFENCK
ncbi:NADPH-dependent oxidoreductase [Clostridium drakei]|uniref:NADPH-dependent oxidoreductase n=1 Tax=Clostridium drakei TaxID=332101 RepID=A0A2U8DPU3_9CLOT|nr:NADPH-dependent oxidoreductase [Clostridium drakei]AWI04618.1 NADPH-dependent oxidoreductase [Clostridium drakei]